MRRALPLCLLALCACSKATELTIDITAGQETDAFSADPAVTRVDVEVTSLDGEVNLKASAEPGGTFDLGNVPIDAQISVEVTGFDASGNAVMRGRSLAGLPLDGITGGVRVFAQRTGAFARPPGALPVTHVGGVASTLGERYVVVAGGMKASGDDHEDTDPANLDAYDVFTLGGASANTLPRRPESLVSLLDLLLAIDAGGATWVDYLASSTYDATLPDGLASFGELAGGASVASSDGRVFVVGGTRRTAPSSAVLQVASDGTLTAYKLGTARMGAAAVWIEGVGLVVAGGSAEGAGVEVLPPAGTSFASRGFPADPVEGAGAVTDGGNGLALIGGTLAGAAAPTRLLQPGCVTSCTVDEVPTATLPAAITSIATYLLTGTRILVVGQQAPTPGLTRAFVVDLIGGADEIPLKEPRIGAVPVPTPLGNLAILGGEHPDGSPATSIEMLWTTN